MYSMHVCTYVCTVYYFVYVCIVLYYLCAPVGKNGIFRLLEGKLNQSNQSNQLITDTVATNIDI